MIKKLVQSTRLPVTVKMRLGFYDDENLLENAIKLESAGIAALAIHGRTTKQKFAGVAQWGKIYEVKEKLSIPVIGNGDITSALIAKDKLQNLDGVMIGRAAIRNPWIFKQVREAFEGKAISEKPALKEQLEFFKKHAQMATDYKNEKWAMIELRKHFSHFLRGFRGASKYRDQLIRVTSLAEMEGIFEAIIRSAEVDSL